MVKKTSKSIVKILKERAKADTKINITFRLPKPLIDDFRKKCHSEQVSMASVIELLLEDFVRN